MKHAAEILASVEQLSGQSARDLSRRLGINVAQAYAALRWLQARGEVTSDNGWPARWAVVTDDAREPESPKDAMPAHEHAAELLAEAMKLPGWSQVAPSIRRKIEHAWVELSRTIPSPESEDA